MSGPYRSEVFEDDLHTLMAVAVLIGQRGVEADVLPVYEAWSQAYPRDALGGIGRGLAMIGAGEPREGYAIVEEAARTAETRREQAAEVLERLRADMAELARQG